VKHPTLPIICADPICGHLAEVHEPGRCNGANCQCTGLLVGLTEREIEIFERTVKGWSCKEIAADLHIAESTATVHRNNIYLKTGACSAVELLAGGLRAGMIQLAELPPFPVRIASAAQRKNNPQHWRKGKYGDLTRIEISRLKDQKRRAQGLIPKDLVTY